MAKTDKRAATKVPAVKTTAVVTEAVAKAIENVKQYFPHVKTLYVKSNGDYHFHQRPGFDPVSLDGTEIVTDNEPETPSVPAESAPVVHKDNLEF